MQPTWLRLPLRPPPLPPPPATLGNLEQHFAGRLLNDRALSGELTDDQYGPLLERALRKLRSAVLQTRGMAPGRARQQLEEVYRRTEDGLRLAVKHAAIR